jgi:serine/threonine-protein kinase
MSAELPLPVGTRLGSYRITGKLGEGGMGTVYSAEHVELGKRVAIKTLRTELAANAQVRARFVREGRAAASVRHPHVVDVHDVGVHGDVPYLVMELLQGRDLSAHVSAAGRLPVQEVADLVLPVLTAMAEAHSAGIVHRDLKPENIFLQRSTGGSWTPKVLDFGISKLRDTESMSLTGSGTLLGTPYYMAPEQASSARDVDARADIYSIGVILYHCVSGNVPFTGTSLVQVIGQILTATPPPLRDSVPDVPAAFEHVVQRAMAKDADARFQSAQELGRALLPFVGERTRINYEHELVVPGGGPHATQPFSPTSPHKPTSTLDPTANSVVLEGRRAALPVRTVLLMLGALALIAGGLIGLRMRDGDPAAGSDADSTVTSPSAAASAATDSPAAPAAEANTAGTAAPVRPTPTQAPSQTPTAVPARPDVAAGTAVTAVDAGTSADVAPRAKPDRRERARKPRRPERQPSAATPDTPTAAPKPPASDPFSERK